jgi:hypothetical protein
VIAALTLMTYINLVAALIASRMTFDAYGDVDMRAVGVFAAAVILAYGLAGFSNFFLRRPFVSDAFLAFAVMVSVAAFIIFQFTTQVRTLAELGAVDWRMVPAAILILFAVFIFAALAMACSTRLDMIPTLAVCSAIFMLGLMSDYLFGRRADPVWRYDLKAETINSRWSEKQKALLKEIIEKYDHDRSGTLELLERDSIDAADRARLANAGMGGARWASVLYTITPNWQLFWIADALEEGKSTFHWGYVGKALAYAFGYVGAALSISILLFEDRELS